MDPTSGDPDLYIWPPDYSTGDEYWYSLNGADEVDEVQFDVPASGSYQIEVEGFTAATYNLSVELTASCPTSAAISPQAAAAKTPRAQPAVPVASAPPGELAVLAAPTGPGTHDVYLPVVVRGGPPATAQKPDALGIGAPVDDAVRPSEPGEGGWIASLRGAIRRLWPGSAF